MKNILEWFDGSQGELQPALATGATTKVLLPRSAQPTEPALATATDAGPETTTNADPQADKQLARLETPDTTSKDKATTESMMRMNPLTTGA